MAELPALDRREFTVQSALALLGGVVTITITGCGGSGSGPSSPTAPAAPAPTPAAAPAPGTADMGADISSNHGHSATITAAQLTAGNALLLSIKGVADHTHMVELTAAEIARIRNKQEVSKASTMDGSTMAEHQHMVTFAGEGAPGGPGY